MKRYRTLPIWINYNVFTEKEREAALRERVKRFRASKEGAEYAAEHEEWRKKHNREPYDYMPDILAEKVKYGMEKRIDEIRVEKDTKVSKAYEDKVTRVLDDILKTPPGKLLLSSLSATPKIWIVMYDGDGYAAATLPGILPAEQGGGIRVLFDPDSFDATMEYYTPDDVLFHELIHAYRTGKKQDNRKSHPEYKTAEEFLAIHVQNVYMAYMGRKKYYFSHTNTRLETKDVIYDAIRADKDLMEFFKYFLAKEPFAQAIAKFKEPDFNCWRDIS